MITLQPVQSSTLAAIGYNEGQRLLAVEFASGDVWHYVAVPKHVWQGLSQSPSPGAFYARNIRGHFSGAKQAPPPERRA